MLTVASDLAIWFTTAIHVVTQYCYDNYNLTLLVPHVSPINITPCLTVG
jgi:hypothetical protein